MEKGVIPKDESIVIAITGNGLKTQGAIRDSVGEPLRIEPSLKSFESILHEKNGIMTIRAC